MPMPRTFRHLAAAAALVVAAVATGCAATTFFGYKLHPRWPTFADGAALPLPGLRAAVDVTVGSDGRYDVSAQDEADLYRAAGYLQARDRMFQLDLLRHAAKGELAALLGNIAVGDRTVLDGDVFNRFIGIRADAERLVAALDDRDRSNLEAFSAGINHWIATGRPSLEHRLLGAEVAPWTPLDTMAIFRLFMFGLTHNYSREVRRILIACAAGWDAMERVWPTGLFFGPYLLPDDALPDGTYDLPDSVAPELREALPRLCPRAATSQSAAFVPPPLAPAHRWLSAMAEPLSWIARGLETSNNWALAATRTTSGHAMVANDPHLPHMNPPVLWGTTYRLPNGWITGFAMVGVPYVVFGHNRRVAWSMTINNVDLQDVYVLLPDGADGYTYEGTRESYVVRSETFAVKDGDTVTRSARMSRHGPVLNDVDPFLDGRVPPLALRTVDLTGASDAQAFRDLPYVRDAADLRARIQAMDSACLSFVYGDVDGNIAWSSPCRVPKRVSHRGDVPAPGWLRAYEWQGVYTKSELPSSWNPARGWLATGNNHVLPPRRFPTPYENDPSPPNRYVRIGAALAGMTDATVAAMARLQLDVGLAYWPALREQLAPVLCERHDGDAMNLAHARALLCDWSGDMASDSRAATLFLLMQHAALDRGLADELPGHAAGELWRYLQSIAHVETLVDWHMQSPVSAPVWDDVATADVVESKLSVFDAALADAVRTAESRWGADMAAWAWGDARPFVIEHPFGRQGGMLGDLFNSATFPGQGAPETVFKNQFLRSDRTRMHAGVGPVIHAVYDLGGSEPGTVTGWFNLAGGASGWPRSPHYADQVGDWRAGRLRRSVGDGATRAAAIRLVP